MSDPLIVEMKTPGRLWDLHQQFLSIRDAIGVAFSRLQAQHDSRQISDSQFQTYGAALGKMSKSNGDKLTAIIESERNLGVTFDPYIRPDEYQVQKLGISFDVVAKLLLRVGILVGAGAWLASEFNESEKLSTFKSFGEKINWSDSASVQAYFGAWQKMFPGDASPLTGVGQVLSSGADFVKWVGIGIGLWFLGNMLRRSNLMRGGFRRRRFRR